MLCTEYLNCALVIEIRSPWLLRSKALEDLTTAAFCDPARRHRYDYAWGEEYVYVNMSRRALVHIVTIRGRRYRKDDAFGW